VHILVASRQDSRKNHAPGWQKAGAKVVKRLIFWHNRRFSTIGKWLAPRCGPFRYGRTRVGYRQIKGKTMKEGIHPDYREVLFIDVSNDFKFVTRSTIQTRETAEFNGKTYPLAKIEVSSESHPFYTGQQKIMDTAGRVEKFNKKFGARATGKAAAK
jgi:large subunit ribosomal protein L31